MFLKQSTTYTFRFGPFVDTQQPLLVCRWFRGVQVEKRVARGRGGIYLWDPKTPGGVVRISGPLGKRAMVDALASHLEGERSMPINLA